MSETQFVKFEIEGHLAIFTLNRPKAMNAVNQKLSEEFENALETFENDDSLWVRLFINCDKEFLIFELFTRYLTFVFRQLCSSLLFELNERVTRNN